MKNFLFGLAILLTSSMALQDLICNGDFQIYSNPFPFYYPTGQYTMFGTFPEDYNCWYRIPKGKIQVINTSYALFHTKMVQLADLFDYFTLCQRVTLVIDSKYSLSVNVVKPMPVASATAYLYINNVQVSNVTSTDYLNSQKIIYNFTALSTINQICINGSFESSSITKYYIDDFTPLIDNISLIQILNFNISQQNNSNITSPINSIIQNSSTQNQIQDIFIFLLLTYNQEDGTIFLNSASPLTYSQFLFVQNYCKIQIQGQLQTDVTYLFDPATNLFNVTLLIARDYDLQTVNIAIPTDIMQTFLMRIVVSIEGKDIYVYFISEKMIKLINTIDPVSSALIDGVTQLYAILKLSFCSYFVINMINFYSLTLMYNFLGLSAQPIFSRIALEKLSQIFYKRNSFISYLQSIFNIQELNQVLKFDDFVDINGEKVQKFNNGFSWFGNMGITSNFPSNNIENVFFLVFLIVKISVLKLLKRNFPSFTCIFFGNLKNLFYAFIVQFICMSPLMTVSASSTLMNSGNTKFTEIVNFILNLGLQFIIILCPFIYLLKIAKYEKHYKSKKNQKKIRILLMKFFQYLFNVLLPILVVVNNEIAFFVVITFYIILLVSIYLYSLLSFSIFTRIFKSLMILLLVVHHFSFMLIYLTGIINEKFRRFQILNQCCKIAGLIVIFTVLSGGILEILDFIRGICTKIISYISKCCKKKVQNNQASKQLEQIQNNKKTQQECKKEQQSQVDYITVQKVQTKKKTIQLKKGHQKRKKAIFVNEKSVKVKKAIKFKTEQKVRI